ncbi:MAG: GNAT family N-acetyltransferase [Candidatus Zapsychrus exili]|nr:GNAT family N-acetyltransferase [Candidatus Zapsychrus exili]
MEIEIREAKSIEEVEKAYRLSSVIFGNDSRRSWSRKRHTLFYDKMKSFNEVIIAVDNDKIVGALRIVERRNIFLGSLLKTAGITNVCVSPCYQGKGLGRRLVSKSIEIIKERKYPFVMLVARRAVDGFYSKYGFVGTGIFSELKVDLNSLICIGKSKSIGRNNFQEGFDGKFAKKYAAMYNATYKKIPMSFCRSSCWWDELIQRSKHRIKKRDFINIVDNEKLIGYFVRQDNKIVEAAFDLNKLEWFCEALVKYFSKSKERNFVMTVSPSHICAEYLMNHFNHVLLVRRPFNGGHMMQIIDPQQVEKTILRFVNIDCREFSVGQRSLTSKKIKNLFSKFAFTKNDRQTLNFFTYLSAEMTGPIEEKIKKNILHSWSCLDEF